MITATFACTFATTIYWTVVCLKTNFQRPRNRTCRCHGRRSTKPSKDCPPSHQADILPNSYLLLSLCSPPWNASALRKSMSSHRQMILIRQRTRRSLHLLLKPLAQLQHLPSWLPSNWRESTLFPAYSTDVSVSLCSRLPTQISISHPAPCTD